MPTVQNKNASANDIKIMLCMIARNEGKIIRRCMESAFPILDAISICEGGASTDNMVEVIEQFIKEKEIKGKVTTTEWKNFSYNRSLSYTTARDFATSLGWDLSKSYALLLDGDMVLEIGEDFSKKSLNADGYSLFQTNGNLRYPNVRLVCLGSNWKCVGVTHEFWECGRDGYKQEDLESLEIDDRNDGGCKSDKYERDIKLLTQGLIDEPGNIRYLFYLAQSYGHSNQYEKAIEWYQKRMAAKGWEEEVWYSQYKIGDCYRELKKWDLALESYLKAYEMRPTRAEPLYAIAYYYRNQGKNNLCYTFAKRAKAIPYPKDRLFVDWAVYKYELLYELSIAGFYTPWKDKGYDACEEIILSPETPHWKRSSTRSNEFFYIDKLKVNKTIKIQFDTPLIRKGSEERYRPMNPSMVRVKNGYMLLCRTVNYDQLKCRYTIHDLDGVVRTKNFMIKLNDKFQIESKHEIIENLNRKKLNNRQIEGLEDCRLFRKSGKWWFTCTTLDTNPTGRTQISLCRLAENPSSDGTWKVEFLLPLKGPDPNRNEKNWLPFEDSSKIKFIYSHDPIIVKGVNLETGECPTLIEKDSGCYLEEFRGSSTPVQYQEGYLTVIHEVIMRNVGSGDKPDWARHYFHRFVRFDKDFQVKELSRPFYYDHKGIEFCAGLCWSLDNKNLLMTVGLEDHDAYIYSISAEDVEDALYQLNFRRE